MHKLAVRLLIAANIYIENIEEREEFKNKLYEHLSEHEPEVLDRLLAGV